MSSLSYDVFVPASPFFDVGPGSISLYLGDGAYETIQLEQPFMYGGKAYTQLYVSTKTGNQMSLIPTLVETVLHTFFAELSESSHVNYTHVGFRLFT